MARKESAAATKERGFSDIIGIVLTSVSLLLLVALFSYDRYDVSVNTASPNEHPHNWIGPIGAWMAAGLFFLFGAAAYLVPALFLTFGLAQFFPVLGYLNGRWAWAGLLFVSFMGALEV